MDCGCRRPWCPNLFRHSGARAKRASPESILTIVVMDSGPAPSGASRNDDDRVRRNASRNKSVPHPNDPKLRSFIAVDPTSDFPIQNLPYGVFSAKDGLAPRVGVAIGDYVLDLWELEQDSRLDVGDLGVFSAPSLNPFMALGPKMWSQTRARISELLRHDNSELRDNDELRARALVPMANAKLHLPIAVAGYTDFYSAQD